MKHFSCETYYDVIKEEVWREECGVEYDTTCHQELSRTFTIRGYEPQKMKRDLEEPLVPVTQGKVVVVYSTCLHPLVPGCYPVPRRVCRQVPDVRLREVPRTSCHPVPDIECANVLKPVKDVTCEPVVTQDCKKLVVEVIPYSYLSRLVLPQKSIVYCLLHNKIKKKLQISQISI